MKCDVIDGSVVKGMRGRMLFRFILDKLPGYKHFCEPKTIPYKKSEQICFEYNNTLCKK